MNPQSHGAIELSDEPSRFARVLLLIAGCIAFLLLGAAQANALESTVSESVEPVGEVAESTPVSEETETVAEVEENPVGTVTATVETTASGAAKEETTEDAVATLTEKTRTTVVETAETVETAAEDITTTAVETTETVTEEAAAITNPLTDSTEELVTVVDGLADTTDEVAALATNLTEEFEAIAPELQPIDTSAPAPAASAPETEPRFDSGPPWSPHSSSDRMGSGEVADIRLVTKTAMAQPNVPGSSSGLDTPAHLDPAGGPPLDLVETVWRPIPRAGPPPDAAQSIVFLSAVILLTGLVAPRLADWLRLQPLIWRDDGLELAIELPG